MRTRRRYAFLLALILSLVSLFPAGSSLAADTEEEEAAALETEEETEEGETEEESAEEKTAKEIIGEVSPADVISMLSPETLELIAGLDTEQISEALQKTYEVVTSEKFVRLMQYPQVRELMLIVFKRTEGYFRENKDTAVKVCEVIGLKEEQAGLLLMLLDTEQDFGSEFEEFRESKEGKKILAAIEESLDKGELLELLKTVVETSGYPGGEASSEASSSAEEGDKQQ